MRTVNGEEKQVQQRQRLWGPDASAPGHFGTIFKPNHRWSCVLSELSWVQSVPTLRRSDAEVSRSTFLMQKCLEAVLKCLMRVRSVLVPKCHVAEVSGNRVRSHSGPGKLRNMIEDS